MTVLHEYQPFKKDVHIVYSVQTLTVNAFQSFDEPIVDIIYFWIMYRSIFMVDFGTGCIIIGLKMLPPPHGDVHKQMLIPFVYFIVLIKFCWKNQSIAFIKMLCTLPVCTGPHSPINIDQRPDILHVNWLHYYQQHSWNLLKNQRTFLNTLCDSCQTLSFVYYGIFIKKNNKGLIWITA